MKGTSPAARSASMCQSGNVIGSNSTERGEVMGEVTTLGIDLAKRVFALHGVDCAGRVVLRRMVRREQLVEVIARLSPCLIGMEAGSGAHEWGRRFQALGHTVRLMAAKFV